MDFERMCTLLLVVMMLMMIVTIAVMMDTKADVSEIRDQIELYEELDAQRYEEMEKRIEALEEAVRGAK